MDGGINLAGEKPLPSGRDRDTIDPAMLERILADKRFASTAERFSTTTPGTYGTGGLS
jgi:hypothetical protein